MNETTEDPKMIGTMKLGENFQEIIQKFKSNEFESIKFTPDNEPKGHQNMLCFSFNKPNEHFYIDENTGSVNGHNWVLTEIKILLIN